jgi:hypothetical protein
MTAEKIITEENSDDLRKHVTELDEENSQMKASFVVQSYKNLLITLPC